MGVGGGVGVVGAFARYFLLNPCQQDQPFQLQFVHDLLIFSKLFSYYCRNNVLCCETDCR